MGIGAALDLRGVDMRRRSVRVSAVVVAGLAMVVWGQVIVENTAHGPDIPMFNRALQATVSVAYLAMGAALARTRPDNPLGMLLAVVGLLHAATDLGLANGALLWTAGLVLGIAYVPVVLHAALAMPSGYLRRPAERWTALVVYVTFGIYTFVGWMFADNCAWPEPVPNCPGNLLVVRHDPPLAMAIDEGFAWLYAGLVAWVTVLVVRKMVRNGRRTRLAVAPVLVALLMQSFMLFDAMLRLVPPSEMTEAFFSSVAVSIVTRGAMPAAFGIGIVVSGMAHRRVSGLVRELSGGATTADLEATIADALGDPDAKLAFTLEDTAMYVTADGSPIDVAELALTRAVTSVEQDGVPVAAIIHDPQLLDERELLDAVCAAVSMSLHNQRLTAQLQAQLEELRASRRRVVEAGDIERRRLERDLHDGAQQRLLSVALELGRAREQLDGTVEPEVQARLDAAAVQLDEAVEELRHLARGVHPPILTHHGLAAALEALSERTPVPVEIHDPPGRRLAEPVEVAVYYLVAEGVVNAARHGQATHVDVRFHRDDDRLRVQVADDGAGGADPTRGSGLIGLRDRLDAIGGDLDITSDLSGTCLTATVPAAAAQPT